MASETRLTASARNSNSNNRKWTGWYYLKSRALSTVRKPWVPGWYPLDEPGGAIPKEEIPCHRSGGRDYHKTSVQSPTMPSFASGRRKLATNASYWHPHQCGFPSQALLARSGLCSFLRRRMMTASSTSPWSGLLPGANAPKNGLPPRSPRESAHTDFELGHHMSLKNVYYIYILYIYIKHECIYI